MKSVLDPGLVGLSLTFVLQLQGLFQWAVRQRYCVRVRSFGARSACVFSQCADISVKLRLFHCSAETENLMTSVERVLEYSNLAKDAPARLDSDSAYARPQPIFASLPDVVCE